MNKRTLVWIGVGAFVLLVVGVVVTKNVLDQSPSLEVGVSGPQVIEQSPVVGQWLDLNARIELTFDRDMDQPRTTDSFSLLNPDLEPVAGEISWANARTLLFVPASPWIPSSDYRAVFSTGAAALDGSNPAEEIVIEFTTIDALALSQVIPANMSTEVDLNATITLIFNHPVVPVSILEEREELPQLEITPPIEGKGEWVNSSVYLFEPAENLKSNTRYRVRVEAGLEDVSGNSLEQNFEVEFTTRAPAINHIALTDGQWIWERNLTNILLDQSFIVNFDAQEMDQDSVEAATRVVDKETQREFPVEFEWNEAGTEVVVSPVGNLKIDGYYQFIVDGTAQAADGGFIVEPWIVDFSTVPYPAIVATDPTPNKKIGAYTSRLSLTFASPMDVDTIADRVRITPALGDDAEWYFYFYNGSYVAELYGLEPSVNYVIRILPGMKDIYGNAIKEEMSFSFTNAPHDPYAYLAMPQRPLTYRADGIQDIYFQHRNLSGAKVSVYPLSLDEYKKFFEDDIQEETYSPTSEPVREWEMDSADALNEFETSRITLTDDDGNPLEPGFYFVGTQIEQLRHQTRFFQGTVFIIATDNITMKSTSTEGLVWLTDFAGGVPQSNVPVTFYDAGFEAIGKGRTGQDGVFLLGDLDAIPNFAVAEGDGHFAFTSIDWGSGARVGDFGISGGYYAEPEELFAYVYTDRALYRPGQDVYFKGLLRNNDDLHYSLPDLKEVYVIAEYNGEHIYEEYVPVSELGNFTDTITLSTGAAVGTYYISAYEDLNTDESYISGISFRVAEYEKPEFEVTASADESDALMGDQVGFSLDAVYYSGGFVATGNANWFVESSNFIFYPSGDFSGFSFTDWDRDEYYFEPSKSRARGVIDEGELVLDETGHAEISQTLDFEEIATTSQTVTFNANVTDVTGNVVSGSASMVLHASDYYAGIRSTSYVGVQGEPQTFDLVVLDWYSSQVAGQTVTVQLVEREWFSVQEQDEHGNLQWKTSVRETPAGQQTAITDENGLASVSFTPSKGGVYKALVTVRDEKGNTHQASTYLWVSSPGYVSWRQTDDHSFNLIPDKDLYSPGETAKILIAQPFEEDVYALVTYERGHIYKEEVVLLSGNSTIYELPITDDMAPIAYVSVVVVNGAEKSEIPNYKVGMATLNIDTEQKELNVSVSADKEVAGPGEEITFTIETTDYKGDPVVADVSLAVIDKAVMALAPSNSAPMLSSFYPQRGLSVITAIGLVTSADAFNEEYREAAATGLASGGGGGDAFGVITVRENFKDTAIFRAQVETDKDGKAQVTFTLPENLTTWHADVHAVTEDSLVGEGSAEIKTNKPLYVQLQTPRFFVPGDQVQIGAAVHNNTDKPLTVNVTLDAEGVEVTTEDLQSVKVDAGQQGFVSWDVLVLEDAERVDLTATAIGGDLTDATKPSLGVLPGQGIPVISFSVMEAVGTSGILSERGSVTEAFQLPTSHTFSDATINLEISPSLVASIQPSLDYLEDYPYLCMEQTISRFLPNVVTTRLLNEAGMSIDLASDLDEQVNAALQRIYATQYYDGGWSWWNSPESDPLTSAYVIYGLMEAQKAGYSVSEVVLENGIIYLKDHLPYLTKNDPQWMFNRNAFILYVLASADKIDVGSAQLNYLFEYNNHLSLYAKAYLAQAIHMLDPEDERINALMSDLETGATLSAAGAHWQEIERDVYNWNSDTRTTAIVLNAYIQISPDSPVTVNAVRWLMSNRAGTHWQSTQDTAWTLIALTNWAVQAEEFKTNYQYAVGLNGDEIGKGRTNPQRLSEITELQVELQDMLADELNYLVVSRGSGDGNLYYTAYMTTTLAADEVPALDHGINVSREYFTLEDPKTPVTSADMGDILQVRLTIVAPSDLHYVSVDDPLPAGFEAIDSTLAADTLVPISYTYQDFKERGWGWWFFDNIQVQDEKVTISADYLPAGSYTYTYLVRASNRGTFKVIPTTAFEFYFPDVNGRGVGSVFTVK